MIAHVDTLEQREPFSRPLVFSIVLHVSLFCLIVVYVKAKPPTENWGTPGSLGGGGSVGVQAVKSLPLPVRSGVTNPLANDTESRVPLPPKPEPKKVRAPDPDAIPIRGRDMPRKPTYTRPQPASPYQQSQQQRPNQLYSPSGQALNSNMFGGSPGSGVGMGPGSAFGNRFGWYRDLLEQRISQKWRTDEVDPRIQTAPVAIVTFEIQKNGMVSGVRILQTSGNRALDYSAQRAVAEAAPFPPLPAGYERSSAQIEIWFHLKR